MAFGFLKGVSVNCGRIDHESPFNFSSFFLRLFPVLQA